MRNRLLRRGDRLQNLNEPDVTTTIKSWSGLVMEEYSLDDYKFELGVVLVKNRRHKLGDMIANRKNGLRAVQTIHLIPFRDTLNRESKKQRKYIFQ